MYKSCSNKLERVLHLYVTIDQMRMNSTSHHRTWSNMPVPYGLLQLPLKFHRDITAEISHSGINVTCRALISSSST